MIDAVPQMRPDGRKCGGILIEHRGDDFVASSAGLKTTFDDVQNVLGGRDFHGAGTSEYGVQVSQGSLGHATRHGVGCQNENSSR